MLENCACSYLCLLFLRPERLFIVLSSSMFDEHRPLGRHRKASETYEAATVLCPGFRRGSFALSLDGLAEHLLSRSEIN
jgi:hypothetical protein